MKQIGPAISMGSQDWDERLPAAIDFSSFPGLDRCNYGWNRAVFAYRLPTPGPPPGATMGLAQMSCPTETTAFYDGHRA